MGYPEGPLCTPVSHVSRVQHCNWNCILSGVAYLLLSGPLVPGGGKFQPGAATNAAKR
jgi:hypothetical protein